MSDKPELFCSFCGRSNLEAEMLVKGDEACICDSCIQFCYELRNHWQLKGYLATKNEPLSVVATSTIVGAEYNLTKAKNK